MKQKLLAALALILTLTVVFAASAGSPLGAQTALPVRIGELPSMTLFDANKMGELSCPSDHVLVVQVISSYRAWVSCPPSYFIAPVENTPAPVSPLVTPAALSAARMK